MQALKLIFAALCGCLYVIGLLFGWTYQETSVYICIYACPVICILASFIGMVYFAIYFKAFWAKCIVAFNLACFNVYHGTTELFWSHYDVADPFTLCMHDLQDIAKDLNMTYEEVNLWIYCILFFGIIAMHILPIIVHRVMKKSKSK